MNRSLSCALRVNDAWAGRLEDFERFYNAACCKGVFDDRDSDYDDASIEEQDDAEFPWLLSDGSGCDIDSYRTEDEAMEGRKSYRIEKGLDPETGERPDREQTLQEFNEYGLCFDYVAPHTFKGQDEGYWRYQLSYGGPSEEIRFYGNFVSDYDCRIYKAEFWYLDWFDGAHKSLSVRDPIVQWIWNQFDETGTAGHQYQESMKDYEPPVDEESDDE